jgi:hypothetical protein
VVRDPPPDLLGEVSFALEGADGAA